MRLASDGEQREWEAQRVSSALRGDAGAFADLYRAFARPLYWQVLLPKLGSRAAAEEALSETFRAALEHLDSWEPRGPGLFAWLCRIAANRAADQHRAERRKGKALASFEALVSPLQQQQQAGAQLERTLDQPRLRKLAEEVLAGLPPRYRRAIELRFFEERERADCAASLEITLGNFDVLLLRALQRFRAGWVALHGSGGEP
jgi:RNA polymerase sigma-70 factor (ECF subfamily)